MHKKFMIRITLMLTVVLTISCGSFAFAAETTEYPEIPLDMLDYRVNEVWEDEGENSQERSIVIKDCDSSITGNYTIPSVIDGMPVTLIGWGAFSDCDKLTGIVIPEGVKSIEGEAFYDCRNMAKVSIPNSVTTIGGYAFGGCDCLVSVELPDSVATIGECAFYYCDNLETITLPNGLTEIPESIFYECYKLVTVEIPNSVTVVGESAFYGCKNLVLDIFPENITTLEREAFYGCDFSFVEIPKSVTKIGADALGGGVLFCYKDSAAEKALQSEGRDYVLIDGSDEENTVSGKRGDTLTWSLNKKTGKLILNIKETMPSFASTGVPWEEYATYITSAEIKGTCRNIGDYAFSGCEHLTDIKIPNEVTQIGEWAFYGCSSLTELIIPKTVKIIEDHAFYSCRSLTSIIVPKGVTTLGDSIFWNCRNLKNVVIPDTVETIGMWAFYNCESLEDISIPDSVTSIGTEAFRYTSFEEITIPYSVKSIGDRAFRYNENLKKVTFLNRNCVIPDDLQIENLDAVIFGFKGSTAETYAIENGYSFYSLDAEHSHSWNKSIVKATSTKDGYSTSVCTGCGAVQEKTIYKASSVKLSYSEKVYTGKMMSPKVYIKDSKGNTISSKYYTLSKPSGRKSIGKYTYTIKFKGNYSGTKKLTLTIKPKAPTITTPVAAKKAVTVKWKKGSKSQVTGYEVRVATNSTFTKNKKTGTVTKYSTTSKKMTKLKAKTKYYVQVRTYKTVKVNGKSTKIYSDWSKTKSIRTK